MLDTLTNLMYHLFMNIKPLFTVMSGSGSAASGNVLKVTNPSVFTQQAYLTTDTVVGATTFIVTNGNGLTTQDRVLVGAQGQDSSELLAITAVSGNTLTLSAATQPHSRGESISALVYDKLTVSYAQSKTGSYTSLTSVDLDYTTDGTLYVHNGFGSTIWYKIVLTNSVRGTNSGVSDAVYAGGFDETSVQYLVETVRRAVGNISLDDEFFVGALNEARRAINTEFGFGRANAWRAEFNCPVQLLAGTNYIDLPTDIDQTDTNRSILAARYSRQAVFGAYPLRYVDKRRFNQLMYQNAFASVAADTLSNGTISSLTLNLTGDFGTSGGAIIGTTKPAQTPINASFTANNLTTNTLSLSSALTRSVGVFTVTIATPGVFTSTGHGFVEGDAVCFSTTGAMPTGISSTSIFYVTSTSLTANTFTVSSSRYGDPLVTTGSQSGVHTLYAAIPAGTQVWAYQTNAVPSFFTVYNATIAGEYKHRMWFESPIPPNLQGKVIYLDYYKKLVDIRTLVDTIEEPWRDAYQDYLKFAIKRRRDDSLGTNDEDFKRFTTAVESIIGNGYTGQGIIAITG